MYVSAYCDALHGSLRTSEVSDALICVGLLDVVLNLFWLPYVPCFLQLKMLNRIATLKDDGTVVVDVPSTLETPPDDVGAEGGYGDVAIEESLDGADIPYRPPMQIVILIVGTRGDVQPFVAIGNRLQVRLNLTLLLIQYSLFG